MVFISPIDPSTPQPITRNTPTSILDLQFRVLVSTFQLQLIVSALLRTIIDILIQWFTSQEPKVVRCAFADYRVHQTSLPVFKFQSSSLFDTDITTNHL